MEGNAPPAQGEPASSRTPVGSPNSKRYSEELVDHEDMPLKKKPKLHGDGQEMARSKTPPPASDDTILEVDHNEDSMQQGASCSTPQQTPNKVTLNLRSPNSSVSTLAADVESSADGEDSEALHFMPNQPPHRDSDEVVEIRLDDSDDQNGQASGTGGTDNEEAALDLAANLLDSFPPVARSYGHHSEKAAAWINEAAQEEVDLDLLIQVSDWIRIKWLANSARLKSIRCMVFLQEKPFWDRVADIYKKLLINRNLKSLTGTRLNRQNSPLTRLFLPYVELCGDIVAADLGSLQETRTSDSASQDRIVAKHLPPLYCLLRPWRETPFWECIDQRTKLDAELSQRQLAIDLVKACPSLMKHLVSFVNGIMQSAHVASSQGEHLVMAFSVLRNLHTQLLNQTLIWQQAKASEEIIRNVPAFQDANLLVQNCALNMGRVLRSTTAKQLPSLSLEQFRRLQQRNAELVSEIASTSSERASAFLPEFGPLPPGLRDFLPTLAYSCALFSDSWNLVTKARMEIKVANMHQLSSRMVTLYQLIGHLDQHHPQAPQQVAYDYVSAWITKMRIVEFLSSADSHPQLLSRSPDVFSFLFVTGAWREDLTDAVWCTILGNPDPRMCTTMWENLTACARYFTPSVLSSFCRRTQMLSPTNASAEMISFFNEFFSRGMYDRVVTGDYVLGLDLANPLMPIKHLVCLSALRQDTSDDTGVLATLHSQALRWLAGLAEAARSEELRKVIYEECVADLRGGSPNTLGSLESASALLSLYATADAHLTGETAMLDALADELCTFVASSRGVVRSNDIPTGMKSRINLLLQLFVNSSDRSTMELPMQALFQHLFGQDACNDATRDACWDGFATLARSLGQKNQFLDHLIDDFLSNLAITAYCPGLVRFLRASVGYKRLVTAATAPSDDDIIQIPLIEVFWRIALLAGSLQLRCDAAKAISDLYLEDPYIKSAPRTCVVATHLALIERCIAELNLAVSSHANPHTITTKTLTETSVGDEGASPTSLKSDPLLRISSILFFLGTFVIECRSQAWLREIASPVVSEPPSPVNDVEGEAVEIKYQLVGTAAETTKIKHLRLSKNATYADLCDLLKQKTGLEKLWLIHGGATLNLADKLHQSIVPMVDGGLLLVRKDVRHTPVTLPRNGLIATDKAIMNHLDTLYGLLDIQEPVNHEICTFLKHFPPHEQVRHAVLQGDVSSEMLFPPENLAKTSYTILCLRKFLLEQTSRNAVDEDFLANAVSLLAKAVTTHPPYTSHDQSLVKNQWGTMSELIDTLLLFLRERPLKRQLDQYLQASGDLAGCLCSIIEKHISSSPVAGSVDMVVVYACLLEAAMHSRKMWDAFRQLPNLQLVNQWLLCEMEPPQRREAIKDLICNTCSFPSSPVGISAFEIASVYWQSLSPLVENAAAAPLQSNELLRVLGFLFSQNSTALTDEAALRELQASWTHLLSTHHHVERPGEASVDGFVKGMLRLLKHCVSSLKSYKKPVSNSHLLHTLLEDYLFPPTDPVGQGFNHATFKTPILDLESRRLACELALAACDDVEAHRMLIQQLSSLAEMETDGPFYEWARDRASMLRTAGGFSGLRNLTNTCYMNSLTAQLFMNESFRKFLLATQVDNSKEGKLLQETQKLFAQMQNSQEKSADTLRFAQAIRPYEGDQLDVSVQMDVDEFFMLLFDRWEGEMSSHEAKESFRGFYGGELVTQTKSKDCEHVSERVDYLSTIQCEVKGKRGLEDSLKAYIEGDVMEGDNKYKCESCGGRFVSAVKRSCLKKLPDNLIFSLKRFEFDMTTLTRYKVNDEFTFPWTIDMTPYTIDHVNDPSASSQPDLYQLVGIVEHMGTAEAGHYISFIRTPPNASSKDETWARFDDMEVSDFEKEKVAEQCFGGRMPDNPQFDKWYNAYMLFYKRVSTVQAEDEVNRARAQAGPAQHPLPDILGTEIATTNQNLLREYCLLDPSLVALVKGVMSDLKYKTGGHCSGDHRVERDLLEMVLQHLCMIFSHGKDGKDFEAIGQHLLKQADGCATCHSILLDWITDNPGCTEMLLLSCPVALIRITWARLVRSLLESHKNLDPEGYGHGSQQSDSETSSSDGYVIPETSSLQRTVMMLKSSIRSLSQKPIRYWESFFNLWCLVADIGPTEKAVMLGEGLFVEALRILHMQSITNGHPGYGVPYPGLMDLGLIYDRWLASRRLMPANNLIRLIALMFEVVDFRAEHVEDSKYRMLDIQRERFPLTVPEADIVVYDLKRFLMNVQEKWDNADTDPLWPAEIMTQLIAGSTEADTEDKFTKAELTAGRKIEKAVERIIPDLFHQYYLHAYKTAVKMTEAFCLECSSPKAVRSVVEKVADMVGKELAEEPCPPTMTAFNVLQDYEEEGSKAVLDFFVKMAHCTDLRQDVWTPEDYEELLKLVIATVPTWAPGLLILSHQRVRENTDRFMASVIFDHFPDALLSGGDVDELDQPDYTLSALDDVRMRAVRALYERCINSITTARELGLPKRFITNLDHVMGYCASWCEKSAQGQSDILIGADDNRNFDQQIRNDYRARIRRTLHDWDNEIEVDPMASDTEYDSDGSDADDFEVEEVS